MKWQSKCESCDWIWYAVTLIILIFPHFQWDYILNDLLLTPFTPDTCRYSERRDGRVERFLPQWGRRWGAGGGRGVWRYSTCNPNTLPTIHFVFYSETKSHLCLLCPFLYYSKLLIDFHIFGRLCHLQFATCNLQRELIPVGQNHAL